jgi:hypothetical protein
MRCSRPLSTNPPISVLIIISQSFFNSFFKKQTCHDKWLPLHEICFRESYASQSESWSEKHLAKGEESSALLNAKTKKILIMR